MDVLHFTACVLFMLQNNYVFQDAHDNAWARVSMS